SHGIHRRQPLLHSQRLSALPSVSGTGPRGAANRCKAILRAKGAPYPAALLVRRRRNGSLLRDADSRRRLRMAAHAVPAAPRTAGNGRRPTIRLRLVEPRNRGSVLSASATSAVLPRESHWAKTRSRGARHLP